MADKGRPGTMGLFLGDKQSEIKSIILAPVDLKQIMMERMQTVVVMWGGTRGILFYSANGEEILVTPSQPHPPPR